MNDNFYQFTIFDATIVDGSPAALVMRVKSVDGNTVTFDSAWPVDPASLVGKKYYYAPINPNVLVNEATQVDTAIIDNSNSPAADIGALTESRLTGLGMGPDTVIANKPLPGGITYRDLEALDVRLGFGNDTFTIQSTHAGTTTVEAGGGNDLINVQSVLGHTFIDTAAGLDTVTVGSAQHLVDEVGALLTLHDTEGGSGYTSAPMVIFSAPPQGGSMASGIATILNGAVVGVKITNGGSGYTSAPTVTFSAAPSGGTTALKTLAKVVGGVVTEVNLGSVVNVDDSGDPKADAATLTPTTLTGLDMPGISEQDVLFIQAASGTYSLTIPDKGSIAALNYNASAADLQTALNELLHSTGVRVESYRDGSKSVTYTITFGGDLVGQNITKTALDANLHLISRLAVTPINLLPNVNASVVTQVTAVRSGTRTPQSNSVQTLTLHADGGSFTLSFNLDSVWLADVNRNLALVAPAYLPTVVDHVVTTRVLPLNISADELAKYLDPIFNPNNSNSGLPHTTNFAVTRIGNELFIQLPRRAPFLPVAPGRSRDGKPHDEWFDRGREYRAGGPRRWDQLLQRDDVEH